MLHFRFPAAPTVEQRLLPQFELKKLHVRFPAVSPLGTVATAALLIENAPPVDDPGPFRPKLHAWLCQALPLQWGGEAGDHTIWGGGEGGHGKKRRGGRAYHMGVAGAAWDRGWVNPDHKLFFRFPRGDNFRDKLFFRFPRGDNFRDNFFYQIPISRRRKKLSFFLKIYLFCATQKITWRPQNFVPGGPGEINFL